LSNSTVIASLLTMKECEKQIVEELWSGSQLQKNINLKSWERGGR